MLSIKANNWRNHYINAPARDNTDKMLSGIRNLSNPEANINAITTFAGFARAKDVMLLSVASNKKTLQLLHYQEILGAHPLFRPESLAVALSGFGSDAMPVELDIEETLASLDLKTPLWDAFKLVGDDPDAFMALIGDEDSFQHKNVIGLPPSLVDTFITSPMKDPASLAISFLSAMSTYDEDHKDDQIARQKMLNECKHIIQFCWLADDKQIPPLTYSNSSDPEVIKWASEIHELSIMPRGDGLHPNATLAPDKDQTVVYTLMSMKQSLDSQRASQSKKDKEKQPGFKNLAHHTKQLILNATAVSPFEESAASPTEFLDKFLSKKTLQKAKILLQQCLKTEKITFAPNQGFVSSLHLGLWLWDSMDWISNCSIFFCPRPVSGAFSTALTMKQTI